MQNLAVRPASKFELTSEQLAILESPPKQTTRWVAYAGCAKTTMCSQYAQRWNGPSLYLAFNATIAATAKGRLPKNVNTKTAHGYAYTAQNARSSADRLVTRLRQDQLNPVADLLPAEGMLSAIAMRRAFLSSLNKFLISDSDEFGIEHMVGIPLPMQGFILPRFKNLAIRLIDFEHSGLPFTHDIYLKQFALQNRISLQYDYVMVDEAQDLNPVLIGIIQKSGLPTMIVGDPMQSIYAFRGAINAMDSFQGQQFPLSKSFRFGPELAQAANWMLRQTITPPDIPLAGFEQKQTRVVQYQGRIKPPTTVLARTNMRLLQSLIPSRVKYHSLSKIELTIRQLEAGYALWSGLDRRNAPWDPVVSLYQTWFDLKEASEDEDDPELTRMVEIIEQYRQAVPDICKDLKARHVQNEAQAPLIIGTAHGAKGREWDNVVLLDDFATPSELRKRMENKTLHPLDYEQEIHLLYVAITRAIKNLAISGELYHEYAIGTGLARNTGEHQ